MHSRQPQFPRGNANGISILVASMTLLLLPAVVPAGRASPTLPIPAASDGEECTIAVISGKVTSDGRPILWKNRDTAFIDNEVVFFEDGTYRYLALTNAGDTENAWIGVNERGFAILNALSYNLPDDLLQGITNGRLMKQALQICATVGEFEDYLEATNAIGRPNPANIAVIDAEGGAAIFEAGNRSFVRFDADDGSPESEGFLARANFSLSADTSFSDTFRYNRCRSLVRQILSTGRITPAQMFQRVGRDLRSIDVDPYPLPFEGYPPGMPEAYGYVNTTNTISRRTTTAAGVVHGVRLGEDPLLATFYGVVGPPIVTIPLPAWVAAGTTPEALDGSETSPLCDAAQVRNLALYDYDGGGILLNTRKLRGPDMLWLDLAEVIEKRILQDTETLLQRWRIEGVDTAAMRSAEHRIAESGLAHFLNHSTTQQGPPVFLSAGPNPMRESTVIRLLGSLPSPDGAVIMIFDAAGRRVTRLSPTGWGTDGAGEFRWNGRDEGGVPVPSGVYYARPSEAAGPSRSAIVVIR